MKKMKSILKVHHIEDNSRLIYLLSTFIFLSAIFLFKDKAAKVLYLLIMFIVSLDSYQIIDLYQRFSLNLFIREKNGLKLDGQLFLLCFINNLLRCFYMFVISYFTLNKSFLDSLLIAFVLLLYCISIASLAKLISAGKDTKALIFLICYYLFISGMTRYYYQERIRYLCPLLVLEDVGLYVSSLIGIIGFSIMFIAINFYKYRKFYTALLCLSLIIISLNTLNDINYNKELKLKSPDFLYIGNHELIYNDVDKEVSSYIGAIGFSVKDELINMGLKPTFEKIYVYSYRQINPLENVEPKIKDKVLYFPVYSPTLKEREDIHRTIDIINTALPFSEEYSLEKISIRSTLMDKILISALKANRYNVYDVDPDLILQLESLYHSYIDYEYKNDNKIPKKIEELLESGGDIESFY